MSDTILGYPVEYIGDGVYVYWNGYQLWLHANDAYEPTDKIALEPSVFQALIRFHDRMTSEP